MSSLISRLQKEVADAESAVEISEVQMPLSPPEGNDNTVQAPKDEGMSSGEKMWHLRSQFRALYGR